MSQLPKMIKVTSDTKVLVINAPKEYLSKLESASPQVDNKMIEGSDKIYDFIQIFYIHSQQLNLDFPKYKKILAIHGKLWASWPKAKQLETDLSLHEVIKIGYANGLVESNNIRIDDVWTSLKFTRPKPGKVYNNSHAELIV